MKKHLLFCFFAAMTLGGVITSCSDDDKNDSVVCPISETVYNNANGLELTYSGEVLLGKQVTFTPNVNDPFKATLTLSGSTLPVELPIELPSTGVIVGETTTVLNVDLVTEGNAVSFKGEDVNEARTIKYEGKATPSSMVLKLDVTMASNPIQNKKLNLLSDVKKNPTAPIMIEWKTMAEDSWSGEVTEQSLAMYINMALSMAKIDGLTISQCLQRVLNEVSFLPDGNIQAMYKDEPKEGEFKKSPLNMAYYTCPKEGEIRLFLNVPQIIASASKDASKAADADKTPSAEDLLPFLAEVMPQLIAKVPALLKEGIQLTYTVDENGVMYIYLDKEVLLPILNLFVPVIENPEFIKVLEVVVEDALKDMGSGFGTMVGALIKGVPTWLKNTTEMTVGVQFVEAK